MNKNLNLLNYGCGLKAPLNWINFDASPTLRLQKIPFWGKILTKGHPKFPCNVNYGDISNKLPITDDSCSIIYCSHVLEHLSLLDFRQALKETYRMLSKSGTFRGVLPDLEFHIHSYLNDQSSDAAIRFHEDTLLGIKERPYDLKSRIRMLFGNSQHLWMWDFKSLRQELEHVGFKNVRRAYFGDSEIKEFATVEEKDRWDNCLGFQCEK